VDKYLYPSEMLNRLSQTKNLELMQLYDQNTVYGVKTEDGRHIEGKRANQKKLGFSMGRFNTGTTPRIDEKTIDYSKATIQENDPGLSFSFRTMALVRENINLTASRASTMVRVGPRYCPSIEEKAVWFPEKTEHLIFKWPSYFTACRYSAESIKDN